MGRKAASRERGRLNAVFRRLRRFIAAARQIERHHACALQPLRQRNGLILRVAIGDEFTHTKAHHHEKSWRSILYALYGFQQKAHAVVDGAAIVIATHIDARREKLLEQIAVGSVYLHAIVARDPQSPCGAGEMFLHSHDFSHCHRLYCIPGLGIDPVRRPHRRHARLVQQRAMVIELPEHMAIMCLDRFH